MSQSHRDSGSISGGRLTEFAELFHAHFERIYRYLDRLTGDRELAADIAQEAFIRLHRRGSLPDAPAAWLITVALNLVRNTRSTERRRRELLTPARGEQVQADAPPGPDETVSRAEVRGHVRATLDRMPERERHMLLLRAEGYSYRDIAQTLGLNEASVGVLLGRAKRVFRETYGDVHDAY